MSDNNSGLNPWTDLSQFFIGNSGDPRECSEFGFKILNWVGLLLCGKIAKIVIYDQARVNGGSNYEYPVQFSRIFELVFMEHNLQDLPN